MSIDCSLYILKLLMFHCRWLAYIPFVTDGADQMSCQLCVSVMSSSVISNIMALIEICIVYFKMSTSTNDHTWFYLVSSFFFYTFMPSSNVILVMFAAFIYYVYSLSPTCITQGSPQKGGNVALWSQI